MGGGTGTGPEIYGDPRVERNMDYSVQGATAGKLAEICLGRLKEDPNKKNPILYLPGVTEEQARILTSPLTCRQFGFVPVGRGFEQNADGTYTVALTLRGEQHA